MKRLIILAMSFLMIMGIFPIKPIIAIDCSMNVMVMNNADSGSDSLRQAIADVCPGGEITFDASLSGAIITLTTGQLTVNKDLTIDGSSLNDMVTISGNTTTRVFWIDSGVTVTLDSLIIADGLANNVDVNDQGGGIHNHGGNLTVKNSHILNNYAIWTGGGISNGNDDVTSGVVTIVNSIIESNRSDVGGGGVYNLSGKTFTIKDSTFVNNTSYSGGAILNEGVMTFTGTTLVGNNATSFGGGIANLGNAAIANSTFFENSAQQYGSAVYNIGTLTLYNSTLSGNSDAIALENYKSGATPATLHYANTIVANTIDGLDCANYGGSISTNINNLVETTAGSDAQSCHPSNVNDPQLGPLADNGGPTQTMALLDGSPAIDAGDDTICAGTLVGGVDQRGAPRPVGDHCDIGAFEYGGVAPDISPPVIASHDDVTAEATSAAGAIVTYTSPATSDDVDGPGTASCTPVSGSQFSIGDTTVTCTAQDAAGNHATPTKFTVHVVDTTAPVVTVPSNISVPATDKSGAIVIFSATAVDLVDGSITPACSPESGSLFSIGTTTVTCTAIDAADNQGQASFTVTVENQTYTIYLPFFLVGGS